MKSVTCESKNICCHNTQWRNDLQPLNRDSILLSLCGDFALTQRRARKRSKGWTNTAPSWSNIHMTGSDLWQLSILYQWSD